MQVILLERIEKLGQMGDVVNVKPGYARNFLLPRDKARRATKANIEHFEGQRTQLEAVNLEQKTEAEKVGEKMDGTQIILVRQAGEAGQLYGSVNGRDIAEAVSAAGFTVARNQIELEIPIKTLGVHDVLAILHPEVTVTVSVNVARSEEEADTQAKTGKAVVSADEEQREAEEAEQAAIAEAEATQAAENAEAEDASAEGEEASEEAASDDAEEEAASDDAEEDKAASDDAEEDKA